MWIRAYCWVTLCLLPSSSSWSVFTFLLRFALYSDHHCLLLFTTFLRLFPPFASDLGNCRQRLIQSAASAARPHWCCLAYKWPPNCPLPHYSVMKFNSKCSLLDTKFQKIINNTVVNARKACMWMGMWSKRNCKCNSSCSYRQTEKGPTTSWCFIEGSLSKKIKNTSFGEPCDCRIGLQSPSFVLFALCLADQQVHYWPHWSFGLSSS